MCLWYKAGITLQLNVHLVGHVWHFSLINDFTEMLLIIFCRLTEYIGGCVPLSLLLYTGRSELCECREESNPSISQKPSWYIQLSTIK